MIVVNETRFDDCLWSAESQVAVKGKQKKCHAS